MAETGLLAVISPELARQRGIGQNKIDGEDLWDHTLRTVDAAPNRPLVRLAALLHDIGKPDTLADGHFLGHETVGAAMAPRLPRPPPRPARPPGASGASRSANHMFSYQPNWSDAAVRRFIRKIGPGAVDDLLALRARRQRGQRPGRPTQGIWRSWGAHPRRAGRRSRPRPGSAGGRRQRPHDRAGPAPGPLLGRLLDELTERVIAEPALNDRAILLEMARATMIDRRLVENRES